MTLVFRPGQRLAIPGVRVFAPRVTSGGGGFVGVLDGISNVAAAYSLRKLRSAYSGYAVRVRRSSDSTEQDIGFDGSGEFDSAAFSSFVSGGTGYVRTLYDQSGNGHNSTQAATGSQPQIVLNAINGKAALSFDGGDYLLANSLAASQNGDDLPLTIIDIIRPAAVVSNMTSWGFGLATNANPIMQGGSSSLFRMYRRSDITIQLDEGSVSANTTYVHSCRFTGTQGNQYVNGSPLSALQSMNTSTLPVDQFAIGALVRNTISNYWNGYLADLIVLSTAIPATDHNTIGNNMATRYGLSWTTVT